MTKDTVGSILSSFNPLNFLSEMYSSTLDYKVKIKQLDNDIENSRLQSKVIHASIQANHKERIEELYQRRVYLEGFFFALQEELKSVRYTREQVLFMAQNAQERSFEKNIDLEERRFYSEQAICLVSQLPQFNVSGAELLQDLVKSLPLVGVSRQQLIERR